MPSLAIEPLPGDAWHAVRPVASLGLLGYAHAPADWCRADDVPDALFVRPAIRRFLSEGWRAPAIGVTFTPVALEEAPDADPG